MKIFKTLFFIPLSIIQFFVKGFRVLSLFLSRGFYYYFEKLFTFFEKIFPFRFNTFFVDYFKKRREQPSHIVMMIVWFLCLLYLFDTVHIDHNNYVQAMFDGSISKPVVVEEKVEDSSQSILFNKEMNLFRIYGKYQLEDIQFSELKKENSDSVAWISVEETNINYPVVQTKDNDYYLSHSFDKSYSTGGWTFMDYRNDNDMKDQNTIFYGHNLLNKTSFGSIDKIFKSNKKNIKIMVLTDDGVRHVYQVFSAYTIEPEVFYLQNNFVSDDDYKIFLDTISSRNTISVDPSVDITDSIITLSTCTDDNKGRKVVHAKLIQE